MIIYCINVVLFTNIKSHTIFSKTFVVSLKYFFTFATQIKKEDDMYLTSDVKKDIFKKHGGADTNTGSAESQVALFSHRITHLTGHLKNNKHDYGTQRALINLVGKRRRILDHLMKIDVLRYRALIKQLELRR